VGIKTGSDGKLTVDDAKLDDKIAANLGKLADLFVDSDGFSNGGAAPNTAGYYTDTTADSGLADKLSRNIDRLIDSYTGPGGKVFKGVFDIRTQNYNESISKLLKDIDTKQAQVDTFQAQLVQKFSNLEQLLGGLQSQGAALGAAFNNTGTGA
jgi:flagellar capping protein FliD